MNLFISTFFFRAWKIIWYCY